jgi:uncharacterized protein DUF5666
MRYAIFAVTAAAALSVAACGSSGNPAPAASKSSTSSASSSSSAPTPGAQGPHGKDRVAGLIASVSGSTIQVTQRNGTATVDVTPSTTVAELSPAQLTDVTAGSCVAVRPTHDDGSGGAQVTARNVVIGTAPDGSCTAPQHARAGAVRGTVASVNGNTVVVNVTDQSGSTSQANVAIDNTTTYAKRAVATPAAITQGKCLAARGSNDSSGSLQATTVTVTPANNGKCGWR